MEFLTVKETAQLLRVSPITVRRYIASGQLAAERVGRGIRVRREAIEEFVTPVVLSAGNRDIEESELPTILEALEISVGIGGSGEPTGIAEHKDAYTADAIADREAGEEGVSLVEIVSPSSPGGVAFVPAQRLVGKPTTEDDPRRNIVGIGQSEKPRSVSGQKFEYFADSYTDDEDDPEPDDRLVKPFTMDDPLWSVFGIGESDDPSDIAENLDEYLADAYLSEEG